MRRRPGFWSFADALDSSSDSEAGSPRQEQISDPQSFRAGYDLEEDLERELALEGQGSTQHADVSDEVYLWALAVSAQIHNFCASALCALVYMCYWRAAIVNQARSAMQLSSLASRFVYQTLQG